MLGRWVGIALVLAAGGLHAQPDVALPTALEGWRDWVLHDRDYLRCPFPFDSAATDESEYLCVWPGELAVEVDAAGGRFDQTWTVYGKRQWLPLPGSEDAWPRDVTVAGRAVEVVLRDGSPAVYLAAGGRHRIDGAFAWDERPATLRVPAPSGLLALTVDGERVRIPRMDAGGVWLGDVEPAAKVPDSLAVEVFRRVVDTVPTQLDTVIRLHVSGAVREEVLDPALPAGFVPLGVASELPVLMQPGGGLRVQARPGDWEIAVFGRAEVVVAGVTLGTPAANMPAEEMWSFQAVPHLRAAVADAVRPVDPAQIGSPWTELPAFRIGAGETLAIEERRRGLADTGNAIDLSRRLWLDFDGGGFVFVDRIGGRMRTAWRLDMAPPFALLGATERGENLQITAGDGGAGIEVREAVLDIEALGRVETRARMPVLGWQSDARKVEAALHLPPGPKLLAAPGVDAAPGSWVGRWRLLDFFVLLVVTVATARLFGRPAGALALVALALSYHEPGAPIWTWLNLLAAVALARAAPAGRLARLARSYRLASLAALLLWLVPFAIMQIRMAVYPQLEPQQYRAAPTVGLFEALSGEMRAPGLAALQEVVEPPEIAVVDRVGLSSPGEIGDVVFDTARQGVAAATAPAFSSYARYPEGALVQAGTGKPDWSWTAYDLAWSGPVDSERTMALWIVPRWLVGVLRFAAILALALFAALFALEAFAGRGLNRGRGVNWEWSNGRAWLNPGRSSAVTALAVGAACLAWNGPAQAQETPSPEILAELERRLLAAPSCAPRCAELVEAQVRVGEDAVSMRLAIHAAALVAVPLPSSGAGWRPTVVEDDRSQSLPVVGDDEGVLWVRLEAGVRTLVVSGPLPVADAVEIPFPLPPRAIQAESDHWAVAGIANRRLETGSLNLTRLGRDADDDAASWASSRLPTFLAVERTIRLDLDWDVGTVVRRIAPEQGAINAAIPLIEGESVVSEQLLADGHAMVSMAPDERQVAWASTLPRTSTLTLQAGADQPWREVWRVRVGHTWQVDFEGVPENRMQSGGSGRWAEFNPRPGESLTLRIARPDAVGGRTLAFDRVTAETVVGNRLRQTTLGIEYRSTRGGTHRLGLPDGARLGSVSVDGEAQQLALTGSVLELPILPGEHAVTVDWDEVVPATTRVAPPVVDLAAPSSNVSVAIEMPDSRWLLFATGPALGPVVLYWSELIALAAAAALLGLLRFTPLRWWHWLLLGLGFSTFSWPALAIVALWLLGFGARATWAAGWSRGVYNLSQIGLGLLTLVAFAAILIGIPAGLLGNPDMHVTGFQSGGRSLTWFTDQTATTTPEAAAWSLPMWVYKALILAWALWLSLALVRWLPWVWARFAERGLWIAAPAKGEAPSG